MVFACGWAGDARAEVYRWVDDSGGVHYTQDLQQVPEDERQEARSRSDTTPGKLSTFQRTVSSEDVAPAAASEKRRPFSSSPEMKIQFEHRGTTMVVDVRLNDRLTAPFLVDTGASDILIPLAVAEELGLPMRGLETAVYETASGEAENLVTRLDSVQVGEARVENARAHISDTQAMGLLGGTFFNNFIFQIDAAAGEITLTPNEKVRAGIGEPQWRERFAKLRADRATLEENLEEAERERDSERARFLRGRLDELESELKDLEDEADQARVPQKWR
jgi:clan AA aspartic protease (TIGR02281 family)